MHEARKQMMIGGKQECLDKIEHYVDVGVTHFIFVSMRTFDLGEITAFAEDVIATVRVRTR